MAYLLHASLLQAGFVCFYWLLLRRETFYKLNRWLLLSSIALSLLLPLISMPPSLSLRNPEVSTLSVLEPMNDVLFVEAELPVLPTEESLNQTITPQKEVVMPAVVLTQTEVVAEAQTVQSSSISSSSISKASLIKYLYLSGVLIFTIVFLAQLVVLLARRMTLNAVKTGKYTVVELVKDHEPYSFLNTIFINPNNYDRDTYEHIFEHEKIHVDQAHFVDKLIAEILVILFWFNPFVWMLRSLLSKNLEFLTDSSLLKKGVEKENYQLSLLKVSTSNQPFNLTTSYNNSFLKNRILMMNAKKSNIKSSWKYLFLLPLFLLSAMSLNAVRGAKAVIESTPIEFKENSTEKENTKPTSSKKTQGEISNTSVEEQRNPEIQKPKDLSEIDQTINSKTNASSTTEDLKSNEGLSQEELNLLLAAEVSQALQHIEIDKKVNSKNEEGASLSSFYNQAPNNQSNVHHNEQENIHVDVFIDEEEEVKKDCSNTKKSCTAKKKECTDKKKSCAYKNTDKVYESTGGRKSIELDLPKFDQINVEDDIHVYLTKGSTQQVKVEGPSDLIDKLSKKVSDGKWSIEYTRKVRNNNRRGLEIYITIPEITAVAASGAAHVTGKGSFKTTDPINFAVSGAGHVDLNISSPKSNIAVSGAGHLTLDGKCAYMKAAVSGAAHFNAKRFETDESKVVVSGAASAKTHANNYLNCIVSGTASLSYMGNPEVSKSVSGLGSIRKI